MYIAPNSNLNILRGVPLDTSYEHTIYFANTLNQYSYFNSLAKYRKVQYSYIKPNESIVRVQEVAENLYDCNYIMFQNTAFGNKWFYAYIKSIKYINNVTSEITFDIDVLQTWLFDFEVDETFVERTHTTTDLIGEHIEPEGFNMGEYVMNQYQKIFDTDNMAIIVAIADVEEGADGRVYDGVYGGCSLWGILASAGARTAINNLIDQYKQSPDSIISMYMCPYSILPDPKPGASGAWLSDSLTPYSEDQTRGTANGVANINGYVPKNNKLYTYPYCFYHVDNGRGSELSLRYEFFTNGTVQLQFYGTVTQPSQVILYPINYKGSNSSGVSSNTYNAESLTVNDFPMCSWNYDAYQAWLAQNSIPMAVNAGVGYVGAIGQALSSLNPIAGAAQGVQSAMQITADLFTQTYAASIQADVCKGRGSNGGVVSASHKNTFFGGKCTITEQYAKCIDDFFTMYGYGVKRIMKPIYNARPHWTYIKTVGCTITGSVPCDDMKRIIDIFDHGITIWQNGSEVGNYSLDNRPVTTGGGG